MSWICPHCGKENFRMPLNSRHIPACMGCGESYITPDELETQCKHELEFAEAELKDARSRMQNASDHISSLKDELASWEINHKDASKEAESAKQDIEQIKSAKVYREAVIHQDKSQEKIV